MQKERDCRSGHHTNHRLLWASGILFLILAGGYLGARQWLGSRPGIIILGKRYSTRIKALHDRVRRLHSKQISVVEAGHIPEDLKSRFSPNAKNAIYTHADEIVLLLQKRASEDVVAHELMHAILRAEGYPDLWCVNTTQVGQKIGLLVAGMLDHLLINQRLTEIGYDARSGFLSRADSYESLLKLNSPKDPAGRAVLYFLMLHQLTKFRYYIGDASAEKELLAKFPAVDPYWETLSSQIDGLPEQPKPQDLWDVGVAYIQLGDRICSDLHAPLLMSDVVGLSPVILREADLRKSAKSIFEHTTELIDSQQILMRIFGKAQSDGLARDGSNGLSRGEVGGASVHP